MKPKQGGSRDPVFMGHLSCVCVCVCVWPYTRHQVITISKGTDNLMFYARKCVFAKMYYGNLD